MAIYHEPKHLGDVLLVEVARGWSRDRATFAQQADVVEVGTVLSLVGGKYVRYDPSKTTAPAAVAAERINATAADRPGVVIARGATVAQAALIWPEGFTDEQIATGIKRLTDRGIVARETL